ncbi:MAG: class I SAM-dependent methyltransferase [Gemmataceae bacterium]
MPEPLAQQLTAQRLFGHHRFQPTLLLVLGLDLAAAQDARGAYATITAAMSRKAGKNTPTNADEAVISDFGRDWRRFTQADLSAEDREDAFARYFLIFPWERLPSHAVGFDLGCGTGRWALQVAPRVGTLHCIDPSDAIDIARSNLAAVSNCQFHRAGVQDMPLADGSCDFGYSLGVLHHVPDTAAAVASCVRKLKPGAPLLLYLYYAMDNRPWWFRAIWRCTDTIRRLVSSLPGRARFAVCDAIAVCVYWPLSRLARVAERLGLPVAAFPLSFYRRYGFYVLRTDALDRFGTKLERRFRRAEIAAMMEAAGLSDIRFSDGEPRWCAIGFRSDGPV